jgi:Domain of unknown function (DUF4383)
MPFGIIQVSILQNLVHLVLGLAGLVSAQTMQRAHRYLLHGRGRRICCFRPALIVGQSAK